MSVDKNFIVLEHSRIKSRICSLYLKVRNAQRFERNEAHGLRCALDETFGLTRFENELLYFFNHSRQRSGDVLDEATLSLETVRQLVRRSDFSCGEDFGLTDDVPEESLDVFKLYFFHLHDVIAHIDQEIANLKLHKMLRAFMLMPCLSSHEHCFPDYISTMLHVIRDAGLSMHLYEPHSQPDKVGITTDRQSTKAEEYFFPFVLKTYKTWENDYLNAPLKHFEEALPQRFLDLMLGIHELATVSHKMIFNEYCRTCIVFSNIQGFRSVGSIILSKENVQTPLNDLSLGLMETLTLISLPRAGTSGRQRITKTFTDRLEKWFDEILTIERDLEAKGRRVSNVKKYASQYDFINNDREDILFLSYRECYRWASDLLQRYNDIPLRSDTLNDYHSTTTLLQLLDNFKNCTTMFPEEFFQYSIDLYRNLPEESLCFPEEISDNAKPHNDSLTLEKSESKNFKVTYSSDEYINSKESESNCQPAENENNQPHSENSVPLVEEIWNCKVSNENESCQTSNVFKNVTSKSYEKPDICESSQTANLSFLPESSEVSHGECFQTESASGDIRQSDTILCKNESARAKSSLTIEPNNTSQSEPCKDFGENVGHQSTDSFTVGQVEFLESSRVGKKTEIKHSREYISQDDSLQSTILSTELIEQSAEDETEIPSILNFELVKVVGSSLDGLTESSVENKSIFNRLDVEIAEESSISKSSELTKDEIEVTSAVQSAEQSTESFKEEITITNTSEVFISVESSVGRITELTENNTDISSTLAVTRAEESSGESTEPSKGEIKFLDRLEAALPIETTEDKTEIPSRLEVTTSAGSSGESTESFEDEIHFLGILEVSKAVEGSVDRLTAFTENKIETANVPEVAIPIESLVDESQSMSSEDEHATSNTIATSVESPLSGLNELTKDEVNILNKSEAAIPTELTEDITEILSTLELTTSTENSGELTETRYDELTENDIEIPSISKVATSVESRVTAVESSLNESTESNEDKTEIPNTLKVYTAEVSADSSTESNSDENVRVKCKSEFMSECPQLSSDDESYVVISDDCVQNLPDSNLIEEKCVDIQTHLEEGAEYSTKCSVM